MTAYKVLRGIDYLNKRAEAGSVVDDIPAKSTVWLLEQGIIEPAKLTEDTKSIKPPKREHVSKFEGDK